MPTHQLLDFIFYLLPGYVGLKIYNSFFSRKQLPHFQQFIESLLCGIGFIHILKYPFEYYSAWLGYEINFQSINLLDSLLIIFLGFTGLFCGLTLITFHEIRERLGKKYEKLHWLIPDKLTTWNYLNKQNKTPWALIRLDDESIYLGWIGFYKFDPNSEDQDFILEGAFLLDEKYNVIREIQGSGVYIKLSNVVNIELYDKKPNFEENKLDASLSIVLPKYLKIEEKNKSK